MPGRLNTAQPALRGLLLPKYENNPIHYLSSFNSGKSIDDLAALVELDIKVAVFDPVFFVVLNKTPQSGEDFVLGMQRLLPLLKRLESECFKTSPDIHRRSHRADGPGTELAAQWF